MARGRQTDAAVLGALSVRPMTGYALRQEIREVLGHFWSESYGQIYPTLTALRGQGLIAARDGDRPGSTVYHLTTAGRRRLRELLAEPAQPVPPRNGLLLRLFFGRVIGPRRCRELVEQARADAQRRLATFEAIREAMATEPQYADHHPYWRLTVSAGEHAARAAIAWADEAVATLDALDSSTPRIRPRRPT